MPNSYTCLHHHIVFSTKNRLPQLTEDIRDPVYRYISGIIANQRGKLLIAGAIPNHVHLLAGLHPTTSIAELLRLVKSNSSGWVHDEFPRHRDFDWQDGYSAFSVSYSNLERVRQYIANQEEHHRTVTFEAELESLLKRHGIQYDPRYLWA